MHANCPGVSDTNTLVEFEVYVVLAVIPKML